MVITLFSLNVSTKVGEDSVDPDQTAPKEP